MQLYLVFQKFVGDGAKIGNLEESNIFVKLTQFNIIFQALKKNLQALHTPTCVFQQLADPFPSVFASLQLCVLFPCADTDSRRQAFPLTLSIKVNLSWVFPEP